MRIIDGYEIGKINIPPALALETVDKTLRAKYEDVLPPKISMPLPGHKFINVMPAIVPSLNAAGVKIVSRYPERSPSLRSQILLYDLRTGEPKALMDADLITSLRTAAVAVHSVRLLAKSGWSSVALIGLGDIGAHIADMLSATADRDLELRLYDHKNRAADFAAKHCSGKVSRKIFGDYEEMVSDADVVISAVGYTEEDLAPASAYKKGVLVVPVHTRGFMDCDLHFDKVVCDDRAHISKFRYYREFENRLSETSEILLGMAPGRENDEQRILSYSIGIALHDVVFAEMIFGMTEKENSVGRS